MMPVAAVIRRLALPVVIIPLALTLGACSHQAGKVASKPTAVAGIADLSRSPELLGTGNACYGDLVADFERHLFSPWTPQAPILRPDRKIADLSRIPQKVGALPAVINGRVGIDNACHAELTADFERHFFSPWTSKTPLFDPEEAREYMKRTVKGGWYGVNKRTVPREFLRRLLDNCALATFPSRSAPAIAVAPGHLRGLPTPLPLYERADDEPFDMLSYPQVKLNEPLRIVHESKDGAWLFVETASSNGWLEKRDVALADEQLIEQWMRGRRLAIVRDNAPVSDGREMATFPVKIGTILPLAAEKEDSWEVLVASADEGGTAKITRSTIPRDAGRPFPLQFTGGNVTFIGDQMLGEPYGWGEIYGLRDCSALLRDFFMPFGIWIPRTAIDQISSVPKRSDLSLLSPGQKEALIRSKGIPFLTLLYKRGHIMLYAGTDRDDRPLIFHDSWSIKVTDGQFPRKQITGISAITTLTPGAELGLPPGESILELLARMGTISQRCRKLTAAPQPASQ